MENKTLCDGGRLDGMVRLEDGRRQVPSTTCYHDNALFIAMLQGCAANTLSPSDLSIIPPTHECTASVLQVWAHPSYWVDFYHPNQPRTEPGTSDL